MRYSAIRINGRENRYALENRNKWYFGMMKISKIPFYKRLLNLSSIKLIQEDKLKTVITIKFIVENGSTIVSVFYDEDGDWQFLGSEDVVTDDAGIISIEQR